MNFITPVLLLLAGTAGAMFFLFTGEAMEFVVSVLVAVIGWYEIEETRTHLNDLERFKRH